MFRTLTSAVLSAVALLLTAVPAGAQTWTLDCEETQRWTLPSLTVEEGERLSLTGGANPSTCTLEVRGDVRIAGTVEYDQKDEMTRAGTLSLVSGGRILIPGTVSANGAPAVPLLGGDGGDAGAVSIRGPAIGISGTLAARGGDGDNPTGGDGGDAGGIVVTGDRAASLSGATLVSAPGSAGAGVVIGGIVVVPPGSPGADQGTVRRNAHTGAAGGTAIGNYRPVNQSPGGLRVALNSSDRVLRWQDRSDEESGFVVVRKIGAEPVRPIGTAPRNGTSFVDSSPLPAGTSTMYAVLAQFPSAVWPNAFAFSNAVTVTTDSAGNPVAPDGSNGSRPATPGDRAVPVSVAIRRALRSGRRLSLAASVDRRLAGQRVQLLFGTGGTVLGRTSRRVGPDGRIALSGTMPARWARARSLLFAVRTLATDQFLRETQIARTARLSAGLRATSGGRTSRGLTVSGRVREAVRGRIILTVRYLDSAGRARAVRSAAERLRGRWRARVAVPPAARSGVVTVATRGDLRYHGQGITARLPGSR